MASTQELTRRIKSVKSTRKITRAMQMVSAAKMRKSQNATISSRSYSQLAWELAEALTPHNQSDEYSFNIQNLPQVVLQQHFPKATKIIITIISSNKGLVGGFNVNSFKKVSEITAKNQGLDVELIVMGKKAKEIAKRLGYKIIADFPKVDAVIPISEIYPIAKLISDNYISSEYKKIYIVYNHYISTLKQETRARQLLPFSINAYDPETSIKSSDTQYLFEPSAQKVLEQLLPRIIESQIFQAVLENDASEHSARMMMMQNATEAARDLIDDLTLTFNRLRQNKITTELAEITAGRIALE